MKRENSREGNVHWKMTYEEQTSVQTRLRYTGMKARIVFAMILAGNLWRETQTRYHFSLGNAHTGMTYKEQLSDTD